MIPIKDISTKKPYLHLGTTIPETSKKYGTRVCSAGYDPVNNEFVRVYPLQVWKGQHFRRWEYYPALPVIRNPKDNRHESWRLGIEFSNLPQVERVDPKQTKRRARNLLPQIVDRHYADSIKQLNDERRSLALISIHQIAPYFSDQLKRGVDVNQLTLFETTDYKGLTKAGYKYQPRIKFLDDAGHPHDLALNAWDAYMHQTKIAPAYGVDNLWETMRLKRNESRLALIGNMNHHRNTWLIISIF